MIDQFDHRGLREALGAYALGHLTPVEEEDVRAHLARCTACRADLDEIAPAAAALARARRPVPVPAAPPADLGARIRSRIREEERRSRTARPARTALISALASAAAAAAVVVGLNSAATDPQSAVPLEAVQVVESGGIQATAALVDHTWGVEVKLTATGLQPGGRYEVWVLGTDGSEYPAGAFVGTDSEVRCNLNSAVLRDEAAGFIVRDEGGQPVLRSDFST